MIALSMVDEIGSAQSEDEVQKIIEEIEIFKKENPV